MKKIKALKGSYTIEASLLFPFILTVLVLIIYSAFFIHDRCVMNTAAYQAALRGSRVRSAAGNVMGVTQKAAGELIGNALIVTENVTPTVKISGEKISVSYEGTMNIPYGVLFMKLSGGRKLQVKAGSMAIRKDPIKFIRECRFVENLAAGRE